MNVTKEVLENKKVKLTINVDTETFEKGMEKSYLKNRKDITIPGFRKGKVPRKIIERYYGEGIFYEEAINTLFPDVYGQAVIETGIEPVEHPAIDIVQIGNGEELILTAEVAVKPEVELGQYKGIEVEKAEYNVTDEQVDQQVQSQLEKNARWITIEDRPVKEGDRITFDYSGSVDGVQFPGGTAEKQTLEIGSGHFIPGFEEQMVGIAIGEERDINVKFPDEYHAEDLKGKDAVFSVKVHEIKEKELPELDDDFAKDVSEFDTLEEYKSDIRSKLEKSAADKAKSEMENSLILKVTDNACLEIPEAMIESDIDDLMRDVDYRLRYNGMDLQKYLEMMNTSEEDFRAQYKDEAYNRVKTRLVLEAIVKAEGIEATDADLEAEYEKLSEQYKRDLEEIKKSFGSESGYIKSSIMVKKAIEMMMSEAQLVDKVVDKKEEMAGETETKN